MIRNYLFLLSLLFVTLVTADLSEECAYVNRTHYLTDVSKVEKCFNTYTVDQDVIDLIFKNLDIIQDLYPYVDIAKNPPKPDGYFKKIDYENDLAELKAEIAESNKTFAEVIPPVMAFVKSFRDNHFRLKYTATNLFDNIFASVNGFLPFEWEVDTGDIYDNGTRRVYIYSPLQSYLSYTSKQKIESMFSQHYYAVTIDGEDAFTFLANIFGVYNNMKSAQARLYMASTISKPSSDGFLVLQYPIDGAFKEHTIVYSDPSHTEVKFKFGFRNNRVASWSARDAEGLGALDETFTLAQEKEVLKALKNFKMRTVRSEHEIVKCGFRNDMNYVVIKSFFYMEPDAIQFVQELAECIADFDTNDKPIVIAMHQNGGGSLLLEQLTEYMLMPNTNFRTALSILKTDKAKKVIIDDGYLYGIEFGYVKDKSDVCTYFQTKSRMEEYWKYTETDKFGDVTHKRTKKLFMNYLFVTRWFSDYKLKNVRKPTDIIVTTEGYCFSACSFSVNNIIRFGAGIVAGYGLTNPGDDLFVAAQCPSTVMNPADYFEEVSEDKNYGLRFDTPITETYNVSTKMDESIPGDYLILRIDTYMKYYDVYNIMTDKFISLTKGVHEEFQTKCNPLNKHLFMVSDECESNDPNALYSGYPCGANGEWDNKTCKIVTCKSPYVLDYDNNKCVIELCDVNYVPPTPSSSEPPAKNSPVSSTTILSPFINLIIAVSIILFNLVK